MTGNRAEALASISEAVDIRRQLAATNPGRYLPDLAVSLDLLSNHQGETGDRAGALGSSIEAADIHRELVAADPAAHQPGLALSLFNLSTRHSEVGDRAGALISITEAVKHYRQLADAEPAVFLSGLAASLNNLFLHQGATGDRMGALASITDAVEHYRELAAVNPAAFVPGLVTSLTNLSQRLLDDLQAQQAAIAWQHAFDTMPYPAARAELRAAWAAQLCASGEQGVDQLLIAAREADEPILASHEHDRGWVVVAMRARKAVRSHAVSHEGDFPVWARAPLPEDHTKLVKAFGHAPDWPAAQAVLDQARHLVVTPEFRRTLTVLQALDLDSSAATELWQLLDEIDGSDIDTVFAARRADYHRRQLLETWISAPTWSESFAFLRQHATTLGSEQVSQLLSSANSQSASQHCAILKLAATMPLQQVEAIVTDSSVAEDTALNAIEHGDLARLELTLRAAPGLEKREVTHAIALMVLRLATDQLDTVLDTARTIAAHATPVQRQAHTIRLSTLHAQRPDLAGLDEVTAIIRPATTTVWQ